jgi:hypothetical protein
VCRRSARRAGGGRGGVVCLAQRRRAAERSRVSPALAVTRSWASRSDGLHVPDDRAGGERSAALRLCATCSGVSAIGSSSGRWSWRRRLSRAEAQSRREVWGVADARRDAELGVPLRGRRSWAANLRISAELLVAWRATDEARRLLVGVGVRVGPGVLAGEVGVGACGDGGLGREFERPAGVGVVGVVDGESGVVEVGRR